MIAAWMVYCVLCAAGLSVAAILAERALLASRGPLRVVWIGAVAASLIVPAVAFRLAPRATVSTSIMSAGNDVDPLVPAADSLASPTASHVSTGVVAPAATLRSRWNAFLAQSDAPLASAWVTLSIALTAYFFGGIVLLAWMRRRWRRQQLLGVDVLVSQRTGPALVGAIAPAIVVPEWALGMEPRQLELMLRHEEEHRRAGDGQLLTMAQIALIVMPWNLALWWQIVRLRMAVELDCDARVLQDADPRSYGDLLLEVARPRSGLPLLGATAFAERAVQLERRIRVMARRRDRTSRRARVAAGLIGALTLTAAWVAPRPAAPPRVVEVPATASVVTPRPSAPSAVVAPPAHAFVAPSTATTRAVDSVKQSMRPSPSSPVSGRPQDTAATVRRDTVPVAPPPLGSIIPPIQFGQSPARIIETVFQRLFDGITLTPEQEARARSLISKLEDDQVAQDQAVLEVIRATIPKRNAVQVQRDSALRTILTSDADRAAFDARVAPPAGGRGGRSGGPPPDSLGGGRRGGGGGGRGGGVGRGASPSAIVDANFHRLFDGIALTPDQEASARATLSAAQQSLEALPLPFIQPRLAIRPNLGVIMQASSDSALAALLTNDADRATLHSRITLTQPILPPRP